MIPKKRPRMLMMIQKKLSRELQQKKNKSRDLTILQAHSSIMSCDYIINPGKLKHKPKNIFSIYILY